jgi:bacteriocin-like protein
MQKKVEQKEAPREELSDEALNKVTGGRSNQAKSNIASTHNKTADAIVQNIRG